MTDPDRLAVAPDLQDTDPVDRVQVADTVVVGRVHPSDSSTEHLGRTVEPDLQDTRAQRVVAVVGSAAGSCGLEQIPGYRVQAAVALDNPSGNFEDIQVGHYSIP